MSSFYSHCPPTSGKVILYTNFGNVDIELFCKECPKACRNFIQLCLEGYYDNKQFHRIINEFMIQCGGAEKETTYGKLFKDEFHSRIKFKTRGMVACVNEDKKDSNTNQFFITVIPCPWLDNKNTCFGRVVGDTFFNVKSINEIQSSREGIPMIEEESKPVIIKTEVLINPFDDIIIRKKINTNDTEEKSNVGKFNLESKKKINNLNLLSFENDACDDDNIENNEAITISLKPKNKKNKGNRNKQIESNMIEENQKNTNISENLNIHNTENSKVTNAIKENRDEIPEINNTQGTSIKIPKIMAKSNNSNNNTVMINLNSEINKINSSIIDSKSLNLKEEETDDGLTALERYRQRFMKSSNVNTKNAITLNKKAHNKTNFNSLLNFKNKLKEIKVRGNKEINNDNNNTNSWIGNKLKFHIDSERAFALQDIKSKSIDNN